MRTLADVLSVSHGGCKVVNIDSGLLFSRLLIIMSRSPTDFQQYFDFELTPLPASLFKDGFMRKPAKAQLANELMKNVNLNNSEPHSTVVVINGGFL